MADPIAQLERLRSTADRLRQSPLDRRIEWAMAACERWRSGSRARASAIPPIARETGLSRPMVEWMLDAFFDSVTGDTLRGLAEREMPPLVEGPVHAPAVALHVLAATVPTVAAESALLSLVAGIPLAIRPSSRQRAFASAFVDSLEGTGASPFVDLVEWPSEQADTTELAVGAADLVVGYGGDAAVAELSALGRRVNVPVQAFGHRVSIGVVGPTTAPPVSLCALDVAALDQGGCMSPHTIFAPADHAESFAADLFDALVALNARLPIGSYAPGDWMPVHAACDLVRFTGIVRAAPSARVLVHADGGFRASPGLRTIHVVPYASEAALVDVVAEIPVPLSVIGASGIGADIEQGILAVRPEGVRLCAPGRMQRPPLARLHDGRPRIAEWFTR